MHDPDLEQLRPDLRFGWRACLIGWVLAYALVFPLKWMGLMPPHLTWLGLVVGPGAIFMLLGSLFVSPLWLGRRWWMLFTPIAFLSWVALLSLIVWERGW